MSALSSSVVPGKGERTYVLSRNPRPFSVMLIGVAALASGIPRLAWDDPTTVTAIVTGLGLLVVARGVQILVRWPNRITVHDDGLTFTASRYHRVVPWDDIQKVRVVHGKQGGGIRWTLFHGDDITTAATFADLHRLLADVEQRAPWVLVTS